MIRKIIVILLLSVLIPVSGCTEKQSGISDEATVIQKTYGGFTLPELQKQELTVNSTTVVFTTSDSEGNFMKKYQKPFNETAFKELIALFEENKFLEMNDNYTPQEGQPIVTDVGTLEISLIEGNKTKTVKVDPYYYEYMPKNLQKIDSKLLELRAYALSISQQEAERIARTWIEKAPTYSFDGFDLKLEKHEILDTLPEEHFLTYTFTSRQGGYGNRTGQMTTQVLTPHKIEVIISEGNIISAVIDNEWDELSQKPVPKVSDMNDVKDTNNVDDTNITTGENASGNLVKTKYIANEEKTPWDMWYAEGNIKFIKVPTPAELIIAYYGTVHSIELYEVNNTVENNVSCSCNESYYVAKVKTSDLEKMKTLGWTEFQES